MNKVTMITIALALTLFMMLVFQAVHETSNTIREEGLKSIFHDIWYGEEWQKPEDKD